MGGVQNLWVMLDVMVYCCSHLPGIIYQCSVVMDGASN